MKKYSILIILLTSFAVYFNALFNGFVYDDIAQILQNPWIRDIKHIPQIMSRGVWEFEAEKISNYFRPMMHVIFMVNYYLFGIKPWGYHLLNIMFHTGVSVLIFLITSHLFRKSQSPVFKPYLSPPFMAAMLFAVHPIHTEAVTWVSALPEVSYAFFFLLSFYFYIKFRTTGDRSFPKGLYILSVASFSLALLFKEPAVTLPVILMGYDFAFWSGEKRRQDHLKSYIPYLIMIIIYFIIRVSALRGFAPVKGAIELSGYLFVMNIFPLFIQYLEKLVLPSNLNVFYVFHPIESFFDLKGILSILLTGAFMVVTYMAFKKNKIAFLSLLFIVIPLLPSLYIVGLGGINVFAERYLYLSSFGFVVVVSLLTDWVREIKLKWGIPVVAVFSVLMVFYCIGTIKRNTIWKDNYTLWADTVEKSPDSALAHQNLGYALLYYKERPGEAKEHFQIAAKLDPNLVENMINNNILLASKGLVDKAILGFHTVLILKPDSAVVHYNLGLAYESKGWTKQAAEQYQIAIQLKPNYADAHNNLGVIYGKTGLIDKAIEHFEIALTSNSADPFTLHNLENAYRLKGLPKKAEEYKQRARSLEKSN